MVCGAYNYSIHGVYKHDQTILARVLFRGLAGAGGLLLSGTAPLMLLSRGQGRPCRVHNGNVVGISLGMVGKSLGKIFGMELTEHDFELLPNNFLWDLWGSFHGTRDLSNGNGDLMVMYNQQ